MRQKPSVRLVHDAQGEPPPKDRRPASEPGASKALAPVRTSSYQSPSSTAEFRSNRFVDITDYKNAKLQVIAAYQIQVDRMASLQDDVIVATARYWGRYAVMYCPSQ